MVGFYRSKQQESYMLVTPKPRAAGAGALVRGMWRGGGWMCGGMSVRRVGGLIPSFNATQNIHRGKQDKQQLRMHRPKTGEKPFDAKELSRYECVPLRFLYLVSW